MSFLDIFSFISVLLTVFLSIFNNLSTLVVFVVVLFSFAFELVGSEGAPVSNLQILGII